MVRTSVTPTGPNSNLLGKDNYPVVQVAYDVSYLLNGLENVLKPNGNLVPEGERVVYIHGEAYLSQKKVSSQHISRRIPS
jgi:hypothetical protein